MVETALRLFTGFLALYFGLGFLFGLFFLLGGAPKVDSYLKTTPKGVRLLLFPGTVATWPFLLKKLFKQKSE